MNNKCKKRIENLMFSSNTFFPKDCERKSRRGFSRICHVHIRKCAGTSLNIPLIKALGGDDCLYKKYRFKC